MAYLTAEEHRRVSAAVAEAEARTSGEIVTVVADRSDGYSDVAFAWAALVAFLFLTLLPFAATLLVSFGSPYIVMETPRIRSYLLAWAANPASERAAARALSGAPITGCSPRPRHEASAAAA